MKNLKKRKKESFKQRLFFNSKKQANAVGGGTDLFV
jgi:hypothetical protein